MSRLLSCYFKLCMVVKKVIDLMTIDTIRAAYMCVLKKVMF